MGDISLEQENQEVVLSIMLQVDKDKKHLQGAFLFASQQKRVFYNIAVLL